MPHIQRDRWGMSAANLALVSTTYNVRTVVAGTRSFTQTPFERRLPYAATTATTTYGYVHMCLYST